MTGPIWVKASASAQNGNCVEMAPDGSGGVLVRDSKDPDGMRLRLSSEAFGRFLSAAKQGTLG